MIVGLVITVMYLVCGVFSGMICVMYGHKHGEVVYSGEYGATFLVGLILWPLVLFGLGFSLVAKWIGPALMRFVKFLTKD